MSIERLLGLGGRVPVVPLPAVGIALLTAQVATVGEGLEGTPHAADAGGDAVLALQLGEKFGSREPGPWRAVGVELAATTTTHDVPPAPDRLEAQGSERRDAAGGLGHGLVAASDLAGERG